MSDKDLVASNTSVAKSNTPYITPQEAIELKDAAKFFEDWGNKAFYETLSAGTDSPQNDAALFFEGSMRSIRQLAKLAEEGNVQMSVGSFENSQLAPYTGDKEANTSGLLYDSKNEAFFGLDIRDLHKKNIAENAQEFAKHFVLSEEEAQRQHCNKLPDYIKTLESLGKIANVIGFELPGVEQQKALPSSQREFKPSGSYIETTAEPVSGKIPQR